MPIDDSLQPPASQTFVVVDVETTGLSPAYGDRVCEVGIVRARGGEVLDTYQALVNPQRPISPGASRVNGLRDADVRDAPVFAEIAREVLERIDGAALVCHNAPFDLGFLDSELSRLDLPWAPGQVFDTLRIARSHFHFRSNSLAAVAGSLGIETPQAHRALGDALTTFQVFCYFQRQLSHPGSDLEAGYRPPRVMVEPAILPPEIQEALDDEQDIFITYIDAKGAETTRLVTPQRVLVLNGSVVMAAYCHLRQENRHFRLDRIVRIE
jgi:DNA polymerase III epsilon subunit family exonuclease